VRVFDTVCSNAVTRPAE